MNFLSRLFRRKPKLELWQVQITGGDPLIGDHFQVAQQEFPVGTHGFEVLAWASNMLDVADIPAPKTFDVFRKGQDGFMVIKSKTKSFRPTYLVAVD